MALLAEVDRKKVANHTMRYLVFPGCLKADVKATIDAVDTKIETVSAAIFAAITNPVKNNLSTADQHQILADVIARRAGRLKTEED